MTLSYDYDEKAGHAHLEREASNLPSDDLDKEFLGIHRASAERKLLRKLDMRILPTIVVIFVMNYIDVRSFI